MGRFRPEPLSSSLLRTCAALSLIGLLQSASASSHGLEISGGIHTNFDRDHRAIFGNATAFSVAYSAPLTPRDVHLLVEIGYVSNSGHVTSQSNPTFELPESHYWVVPFVMGLRTNLVPERDQGTLGLYLGLGVMTLFTGFKGDEGSQDVSTTLGAMLELRPQLKLNEHLAIWLRERINVSPDVSYQNAPDINYSGAALQFGVSLGAS